MRIREGGDPYILHGKKRKDPIGGGMQNEIQTRGDPYIICRGEGSDSRGANKSGIALRIILYNKALCVVGGTVTAHQFCNRIHHVHVSGQYFSVGKLVYPY